MFIVLTCNYLLSSFDNKFTKFFSRSLLLELTIAAAFLMIAIECITRGLTRKSPILKYLFDLSVDAPQYLSPGTLIFTNTIKFSSVFHNRIFVIIHLIKIFINYKGLEMSNFESVKKFMETFGQEVKEKAEFPNDKITSLRYDLIKEELGELREALEKKDIKEVADALTDILYVTYGAGHAFGINLDKCFEEVQNSNMSKLGKDGKPIYNEKGKVMKGPNYFKPDLEKFVA